MVEYQSLDYDIWIEVLKKVANLEIVYLVGKKLVIFK